MPTIYGIYDTNLYIKISQLKYSYLNLCFLFTILLSLMVFTYLLNLLEISNWIGSLGFGMLIIVIVRMLKRINNINFFISIPDLNKLIIPKPPQLKLLR